MIEWIVVKGFGGKEIGAVGFINNKVSIIASYYDDNDLNEDGKVSITEWIACKVMPLKLTGSGVAHVAMQARVTPEILLKDPSIDRIAKNLYLNFSKGLVADGIYAVYFSKGVGRVSKAVANGATKGLIKQYVIRKGMEASIKALYKSSIN